VRTLPFNAIYSAGSSLFIDNSGVSINSIQDYYNPIGASNGINVASNSSGFLTMKSHPFNVINIITASGGGYTISTNTIGYAAANATGITTYDGILQTGLYRIIGSFNSCFLYSRE
jgi:hypothetical protein